MKLAQFKHENKRFKNLIFEEIERTFGGGRCGLLVSAIGEGGNGPILGGIGGGRSRHETHRRCIGQDRSSNRRWYTLFAVFLSFLFARTVGVVRCLM